VLIATGPGTVPVGVLTAGGGVAGVGGVSGVVAGLVQPGIRSINRSNSAGSKKGK